MYKPGGVLMRQDGEERTFILTKKDLYPKEKFKGNEGKKVVKRGKYIVYPLIQKEVTQKITMCVEAYRYMISPECPDWFRNSKEWRRLSKDEKLNLHLTRTCKHFGATRFSYSIIED